MFGKHFISTWFSVVSHQFYKVYLLGVNAPPPGCSPLTHPPVRAWTRAHTSPPLTPPHTSPPIVPGRSHLASPALAIIPGRSYLAGPAWPITPGQSRLADHTWPIILGQSHLASPAWHDFHVQEVTEVIGRCTVVYDATRQDLTHLDTSNECFTCRCNIGSTMASCGA